MHSPPSQFPRSPEPAHELVTTGDPLRPVPRLWRSRADRVFLGVVGGFAEKFDWETRPVRILVGLFGVLSLPLGTLPVLVPYLLLASLMRARGVAPPKRPWRRSRDDQRVAGVLGGLAERLGMSPGWLRGGYAMLTAATFVLPGVITYLVLWARTPMAENPASHRQIPDDWRMR